jgi:hypothetical protein
MFFSSSVIVFLSNDKGIDEPSSNLLIDEICEISLSKHAATPTLKGRYEVGNKAKHVIGR